MKYIYTFFLLLSLVSLKSHSSPQSEYWLFYFPANSNQEQQGFASITNATAQTALISIDGFDSNGVEGDSQINAEIEPGATLFFNSEDIELGNSSKGFNGRFGEGNGPWKLKIGSNVELTVGGYIRTDNGFLSSIHDYAESESTTRFNIPIFNPGSNTSKISKLVLVNRMNSSNQFQIKGYDSTGIAGDSVVTVKVKAMATVILSAQELETGDSSKIIDGHFGSGNGKWRLIVESEEIASVLGLMELEGGYVSNLSRPIPTSRLPEGSYDDVSLKMSDREASSCPSIADSNLFSDASVSWTDSEVEINVKVSSTETCWFTGTYAGTNKINNGTFACGFTKNFIDYGGTFDADTFQKVGENGVYVRINATASTGDYEFANCSYKLEMTGLN